MRALTDPRRANSVNHTFTEMLKQRVFPIAQGYEDCNDAARIRDDPLFKLACGQSPKSAGGLASQPTRSRFERNQTAREIVTMGRALERVVLENLAHRHRRAHRITIDLDGSEDPTHGQQPFAFFNGYYDSWCYVPLFGFVSIDDDPEQHLFFARLRSGTGVEGHCVRTLLRRIVPMAPALFDASRTCTCPAAGGRGVEPHRTTLRIEWQLVSRGATRSTRPPPTRVRSGAGRPGESRRAGATGAR